MTPPQPVLADLITRFFRRHLAAELNASPHTIASYRDTFRLLLRHVAAAGPRAVFRLTLDDFTPDAILGFLDALEQQRGNAIGTRNARLAAIRSFFRYLVGQEPVAAAGVHRILHIPFKKTLGRSVGYLSAAQVGAILAQVVRTTRKGQRDYLLLALLYDTGARIQEILNVCPADFRVDRLPFVRVTGKGRKVRIVPLLPATATLVHRYLADSKRALTDTEPLLRNARGRPLTRSGAAFLLEHYRRRASTHDTSLAQLQISPHTLRHTKAMHLLQAGVHPVTIKDILGHADLKTLDVYVQADLEMKRRALEATPTVVSASPVAPRHEPDILAWLEQL